MAQRPINLREFAREDQAVKRDSRVLRESYWLVSNADVVDSLESGPVYTVDEMMILKRVKRDPQLLRQIHALKKVFKGTVIAIE